MRNLFFFLYNFNSASQSPIFSAHTDTTNKAHYFIIVIVIVTDSEQKVIYLRKCICAFSRIDTTYWYVSFLDTLNINFCI